MVEDAAVDMVCLEKAEVLDCIRAESVARSVACPNHHIDSVGNPRQRSAPPDARGGCACRCLRSPWQSPRLRRVGWAYLNRTARPCTIHKALPKTGCAESTRSTLLWTAQPPGLTRSSKWGPRVGDKGEEGIWQGRPKQSASSSSPSPLFLSLHNADQLQQAIIIATAWYVNCQLGPSLYRNDQCLDCRLVVVALTSGLSSQPSHFHAYPVATIQGPANRV